MSEKIQTTETISQNDYPIFAITFTENAARKVYSLMKEEGNYNLKLRVFITGGGCSGFQYGFAFEEAIQPDDLVYEKIITVENEEKQEEGDDGDGDGDGDGDDDGDGGQTRIVSLVIDPMSYQYLMGSEFDYVEDINGERFVIRNPNAQTTCGCGSSFSV